MKNPDEFDAFYQHARERLVVQTYALTGDLAASRRAVREAFVIAWHRWRKLQRLDDPETVVRPIAWRLAGRRHTARLWHRDKDVDPDVRATLEALGKLSVAQRKAIVLTQCASVTMAQMAREVGLPAEAAARELQSGAAQLALLRDVPTSALTALFEPVAAATTAPGSGTGTVPGWPRASIVRRAGNRRRRGHTAVGVVAACAAVLASGALLTDTGAVGSVRSTLDRAGAPAVRDVAIRPAPITLPVDHLLSAADVTKALTGRAWTLGRTSDNQDGTGQALPCQTARYADPHGAAAMVREFASTHTGHEPPATATEFTEASSSRAAAQQTYTTTVGWFAGCGTGRTQLLDTATPTGVGDQSVQLVLRSYDAPLTTYVVGVARTGLYTTTTVTSVQGDAAPDVRAGAALLSSAVGGLCTLDQAGACAPTRPKLVPAPPVAVGDQPALLSMVDLPPVTHVTRSWAGSRPTSDTSPNLAATACDHAVFGGSYDKASFSHTTTRTFLVPGAGLPAQFGLTETAGALPTPQAEAFVAQVRQRLGTCMDRSLGTKVTRLTDQHTRSTSVAIWKVSVEVTDKHRVDFYMAILRNDTAVGQLGFVPAADVGLAGSAFGDLARRALARLAELPPPRG